MLPGNICERDKQRNMVTPDIGSRKNSVVKMTEREREREKVKEKRALNFSLVQKFFRRKEGRGGRWRETRSLFSRKFKNVEERKPDYKIWKNSSVRKRGREMKMKKERKR